MFTLKDLLESSDGLMYSQLRSTALPFCDTTTHVFQGHKTSLDTSEDLRDSEWLRHETLDLSCSLDSQFVLF